MGVPFALARLVHHHFRGGLQPDRVEHGRNPQSELLGDEQGASDACVHDFGVRTARLLGAARFLMNIQHARLVSFLPWQHSRLA